MLGVLPRALLGVKTGEAADSEAPLDSPFWANAADAVRHPMQKAAKSTFFMMIDGGFLNISKRLVQLASKPGANY